MGGKKRMLNMHVSMWWSSNINKLDYTHEISCRERVISFFFFASSTFLREMVHKIYPVGFINLHITNMTFYYNYKCYQYILIDGIYFD